MRQISSFSTLRLGSNSSLLKSHLRVWEMLNFLSNFGSCCCVPLRVCVHIIALIELARAFFSTMLVYELYKAEEKYDFDILFDDGKKFS